MPKRSFVFGAAILLGANLFNRILGFLYQYLIMKHIGGEAYGLFNMVFPVYMMALVVTTAGIPLAVAKLVAEETSLGRPEQAAAVFHLAMGLLTVSGAVVAVLLYLWAPYLAKQLFPDPRVLRVFLICTPAIFVVSVASAFRGYFQGLQNMVPTALSQICEQITRISLGFALAVTFLPRGVEWAASALAIGMLAGETVGLIVIILQFKLRQHKIPRSSSAREAGPPALHILNKLWRLASPVTAGRFLSTGLSALDAVLIPLRLQAAGYTAREATTLFGQLGGTAFTLLTFPSVFTFALSTSLVPAIAEAAVQKRLQVVRSRSAEAIRLTILLGVPFLIVLFYFARPLTSLFRSANIAPILRILSLGGIFAYIQQTTTGILQGLGKVHIPVINSVIAALVRIPLLYVLTGLPQYGLTGSALGYVAGFMIMASLNMWSISRLSGLPFDLQHLLLQPLTAGLGMLLTLRLLSHFSAAYPILYPAAIAIGIIVYSLILMINGALTNDDLRRLPWLGKYIPRI